MLQFMKTWGSTIHIVYLRKVLEMPLPNHRLSALIASVFLFGVALDSNAATPVFKATELGSLGGHTYAYGLNSSGQVVGYSNLANGQAQAFITGPQGNGIAALGTLGGTFSYAFGINDIGQVVGSSGTVAGGIYQTPFITGPNGHVMYGILAPDGGSYFGRAYGINNSGQVAGDTLYDSSSGNVHGFVTGANASGMTILGTFGGGESEAESINDSGQVAGYATTSGDTIAYDFFASSANGYALTQIAQNSDYQDLRSVGINSNGQVVGATLLYGSERGYETGPNGVWGNYVGALCGDFSCSLSNAVLGINKDGMIVGWSSTFTPGTQQHAFVSGTNGIGMYDLNSLVSLPGGDYFTTATGVNNSGQVIANTNQGYAYLLTPVAVPTPEASTFAMMLAGLGMVGVIAGRKKRS